MNARERTINRAMLEFGEHAAGILRQLRRVHVDGALAAEGMPRLTQDECIEVDESAARGELPYLGCGGDGCRTCEG